MASPLDGLYRLVCAFGEQLSGWATRGFLHSAVAGAPAAMKTTDLFEGRQFSAMLGLGAASASRMRTDTSAGGAEARPEFGLLRGF
jgi:hypothetical protein